jgi:lysozyme
MMSRRTMMAGLSALAAPGLTSCAGRQPPQRLLATAHPVTTPSDVGLDAVIDMNHNSVVIDFALVRYSGNILGVLHKASEGGDWFDPLYAERRSQAEAAGLLWGAYHFGTHQFSGAQQAAAFLSAAQPGPMTLMALDLEPNDRNPTNTMDIGQAEDFVQTIFQATGHLPLIYTHPTWANGGAFGRTGASLGGAIGPRSILASCDLWLADYRTEPELPQAWANRGWRFWQYAGDDYAGGGGPFGPLSRAVDGVDRCDRNLFVGDIPTLYQYWSGATGSV